MDDPAGVGVSHCATDLGEDEDSELGNFIEDESAPTPPQSAYQDLLGEKVTEMLSTFPLGTYKISESLNDLL